VAGTIMTMKDTFLTQAEYSKLIYECIAQDCRYMVGQSGSTGGSAGGSTLDQGQYSKLIYACIAQDCR